MATRSSNVLLIAAIALLSAFASAAQTASPVTRVLFVGNSLTTVHDVPALVGQLAVASARRYEHRTVAFNGYSLEDHWNRGDAQRAIAGGGWSIVVLQQGPSALPESRALMVFIPPLPARTWPRSSCINDSSAGRPSACLH